jgi:hypothetical protein
VSDGVVIEFPTVILVFTFYESNIKGLLILTSVGVIETPMKSTWLLNFYLLFTVTCELFTITKLFTFRYWELI